MDEVTKAQYESLIKKIDSIQKTMDLRFQEWSEDRKDLSDLKIEVKNIKAILNATREDVGVGNQKVMNKVDEHLQPMPDIVANQIKESIGKVKKKKWYGLFNK